ncbi:ABC transporter permease [Aromatoleum buckelii]|uniref:FtsX-like permease family protein n=1 Tax=Aromatoleum buckelii TaxID=200254 RepID=A0ABX1N5L1_9RHOO|nr:ABC transporter permease [Aromatoleum buckelii]MCK0512692.1 ABC transporter permease [Aromatoleum buckelii]
MNAGLRHVFLASLARRRLATALSLLAIALGVALGLAVQLIHGAALDEFGRGMRLVAGEADLQVMGPRTGFDDALYVVLAQRPEVADASPILEVEASLPQRDDILRVFGVDALRVRRVQPALMPVPEGEAGGEFGIFAADAVFLSPAAQAALALGEDTDVGTGGTLAVLAGPREEHLRILGSVPGAGRGQRLAVMDIAAAQQLFDQVGRITRIDLRLAQGVDRDAAIERLRPLLPAGVELLAPEAAASQVAGLSRAYRVNLTMLAAIALLTGGFLVFSTQLLSVVRRRQELAFLRALGLDRRTLLRGLLAEGAVLGLVGGLVGVALGYVLSGLAFSIVGADLGAGYFEGVEPGLRFEPLATAAYLVLGVAAGVGGAWLPAREASRVAPARALRAGDDVEVWRARPRWSAALASLGLALLLCLLPPLGGVPVFGYAAIALILVGSVLVLPAVVRLAMRCVGGVGSVGGGRSVLLRLAHARLAAAPGQVLVAGAGVVASVALAAAMAIMVSSFRTSVDDWLSDVLPADLYLRASSSGTSAFLTPEVIAGVAATPGVSSVQPVRYDTLRLDEAQFPVTLIARPVAEGAAVPLVEGDAESVRGADGLPPAWVSEAMADLFRVAVGDTLSLPLGGAPHRFRVAGVWRDYARQHGAVLVELADYRALTNDSRSNNVAIRVAPGVQAEAVAAALQAQFDGRNFELAAPGDIRSKTLAVFDRTFLVTYLMEAVAILIGLFGVSTSFAALATARRKEFGMLRHLGLTRRDIGRLLALEGALGAAVGVAVGLAAGGAVALVLVEVVNRQSFHWSMDIRVPLAALAAFAVALVLLAAVAARLSGYQAMRQAAVLAVREDF